MENRIRRVLLSCCLLLFIFGLGVARADVVINEVMASNGYYESGHAWDWVELYNNGKETVSLSGWGLTDSKKDLFKFTFPDGAKLKAGGYLTVWCTGTGVETMFAGLSALWDKEKFELYYFLAVDPDAEQYYEDQVVQNGCRVIHLHDLNGVRKLKWAWTLRKALTEYGPFDAVHSNLSLLNGLNLKIARKAGIPVRIAHVHTFPGKGGTIAGRLYQMCMKTLITINATDKLACSAGTGKAAFGNSSFRVIENGIELDSFLSAGKSKTERKGKKDQPRFATVGRFRLLQY